jgi:hypothetical protein
MFAERSDIVVRTGSSAAARFELAEPVASWISAESSDTVVETGTAVAADSRMARHAALPESVGSSDTLAKPETSAVPGSGTAGPGSSSGFDLTRIGTVAKIDIAASANSDCAEPEATNSDILDPGCVLQGGSRNGLHKTLQCRFARLLPG